ncbi:MAG: STAS domain-containing protein [Magnetococcales bacterium]|nr:STAS domain-containing protein [Magnetococcales bacterium]
MTATVSVARTDYDTTINIAGLFDYKINRQFRTCYQDEMSCNTPKRRVTIDLSRTENIDSSALGMLLLLREEIGNKVEDIEITNARLEIRKMLEESHFDLLFHIV